MKKMILVAMVVCFLAVVGMSTLVLAVQPASKMPAVTPSPGSTFNSNGQQTLINPNNGKPVPVPNSGHEFK